jgi:hypothetical protein
VQAWNASRAAAAAAAAASSASTLLRADAPPLAPLLPLPLPGPRRRAAKLADSGRWARLERMVALGCSIGDEAGDAVGDGGPRCCVCCCGSGCCIG